MWVALRMQNSFQYAISDDMENQGARRLIFDDSNPDLKKRTVGESLRPIKVMILKIFPRRSDQSGQNGERNRIELA